jgi:hypothetical protein
VSGRYSSNARFGVDYFEAPKHPSLIDSGFPPMTFFRATPGLPDELVRIGTPYATSSGTTYLGQTVK